MNDRAKQTSGYWRGAGDALLQMSAWVDEDPQAQRDLLMLSEDCRRFARNRRKSNEYYWLGYGHMFQTVSEFVIRPAFASALFLAISEGAYTRDRQKRRPDSDVIGGGQCGPLH